MARSTAQDSKRDSMSVMTQAKKLKAAFEKERWSEAAEALESVALLAQELRRVEISLLAQTLKSDLDQRSRRVEASVFGEVENRFADLFLRLDHLSWMAQR